MSRALGRDGGGGQALAFVGGSGERLGGDEGCNRVGATVKARMDGVRCKVGFMIPQLNFLQMNR